MIEQLKLLFESINRDAKTTFLVVFMFVIYILWQNWNSSNDEFDAMRLAQMQDLSDRLSNCEEHRRQCADKIDDMYKILNRQDSTIIELNAAIRYAGKK